MTKFLSFRFDKQYQTEATVQTRGTLNAEIPSAASISMWAHSWDCEAVGTVKQSSHTSTCSWWIPWNSSDPEAVKVVMAIMYLLYLWCIYSGIEMGIMEFVNFRVNFGQGFFISDPNLVILAWTGDALWHGQTRSWCKHTRTNGQTYAGNDNNWMPKLASKISASLC